MMNFCVQLHPFARSTNFTTKSKQQSRPIPGQFFSSIKSANILNMLLINSIIDGSKEREREKINDETFSSKDLSPKLNGTLIGFRIFRRFSKSQIDINKLLMRIDVLVGISLSFIAKQRAMSFTPNLL